MSRLRDRDTRAVPRDHDVMDIGIVLPPGPRPPSQTSGARRAVSHSLRDIMSAGPVTPGARRATQAQAAESDWQAPCGAAAGAARRRLLHIGRLPAFRARRRGVALAACSRPPHVTVRDSCSDSDVPNLPVPPRRRHWQAEAASDGARLSGSPPARATRNPQASVLPAPAARFSRPRCGAARLRVFVVPGAAAAAAAAIGTITMMQPHGLLPIMMLSGCPCLHGGPARVSVMLVRSGPGVLGNYNWGADLLDAGVKCSA
jgi:hypothetical protein